MRIEAVLAAPVGGYARGQSRGIMRAEQAGEGPGQRPS